MENNKPSYKDLEKRISQLENEIEIERERLQNAIFESEKKSHIIIERITDSFIAFDTNWRYTYINKNAAAILNRQPKDLIGKNVWDEFPESFGQPFQKAYFEAMSTQKYIYLEEYYPPLNKWYENHIYPSTEGITVYIRDITERKQFSQNLEKNIKLLNDMMNNTSSLIYLIDSNGKFISVNHQLAKLFGKTTEEIIGQSREQFIPKEIADQHYSNDMEVYNTRTAISFEEENIEADGKHYYFTTKFPLIDPQNNLYGICGISTDITERKHIEELISDSNKRYHAIVEQASEALFVHDFNGKFVEVNNRACENLGYSRDELLKMNVFDIEQDFNLEAAQAEWIKIKHGESFILQGRQRRKNGTVFPVEVNFGSFDWKGETLLLGLVRDISERMRAEESIKESQDLLELFFAQSLDGFFFMMLDKPIEWNDSINKEATLDYIFEHQRITKANSAILEQYGTTTEQFLGLTPNDFYKHDIKYGRQVWTDFFDNGHLHIDTHEKKFDGTNLIIEGDYICMYDSAKRITGHFGIQKDVTAVRQAEDILQKSKNELQDFWDNDISADYISSVDGEILNCNPTFMKLFGIEEKLNKEKTSFKTLYKNYSDRALLISEITSKGKVENYEVDFINNNGKVINSIINAIGIFDETGNLIKIRGYIVDLTERKNAEEKLKESERKFKDLTNLLPQIIFETDEYGTLTYVNEVSYKLFGYTKKDFKQKLNALQMIELKERDMAAANIQLVMNGKKPTTHEYTALKKDGSTFPVLIYSSPILNNDKVSGLRGTIIDITEQKQAEEELQKLSQAVEQSPASIVITDLNGKIEYVNPKFVELTGYSANEVKGENPKILQSGDLPKAEYKKLWNTILSGKIWKGEFHNKKKNGELYWESATISPVKDKNGKMKYFLAIKEDITDFKKNLEDLVIAKEKAQESDRLKSAFLANMSHEIRTPMNGILGFAGLLKDSDITGEQQQDYIKMIEKSGARMLNIINDIISISKIESGIMEIHLSEVHINTQMEFVFKTLKLDAEKKNLTLSYINSLPDQDAFIITDSEKFYSILTNLVKNAIKYTQKGNIEFGYQQKTCTTATELEFYIKDTGLGIPVDRQEAIFERFIQADIEDKMAMQGAGLGLAISKAYVKMLGGKIWVESEYGKGSTFYFTIPYETKTLTKKDNLNLSTDSVGKNQLGKFKILIVENDDISLVFLKEIVSKISREVLTAKNGLDAITICRQHTDIDLILMDIQMPEINGYNATKQIRKFNKDVIIVAQTALALTGDNEKAIAAGCNDYISKPISKDNLIEIICKHLKNK